MATVSYGKVPFREQVEFLRRKVALPTSGWTDIYTHEHDWAFIVAGANRDEIVTDFHTAIIKMTEEGLSLEDFRKDFDNIVEKYGWQYNGGRNWRSRVIYETNLRSSYMAGQYQQLQRLKSVRPFWQYVHSDNVRYPRPIHESWHNLVLPADDPWWNIFFPPNGWLCRCMVHSLKQRDLDRLGLKVGTAPPIEWETRVIGKRSINGPRTVRVPKGIDPGFEYAPGRARLNSAQPPEQPDPPISGTAGTHGIPNTRRFDELPPLRELPASWVLPQTEDAAEYAQAFLAEFGATLEEPAIFTDKVGERIVIGGTLFEDREKGGVKADKSGRGQFLRLVALALQEPDEIWVRMEWNPITERLQVRRRYIAQFAVEGKKKNPAMLTVFERGSDGWWGVTAYPDQRGKYDSWRVGVRLYRRGELDDAQ